MIHFGHILHDDLGICPQLMVHHQLLLLRHYQQTLLFVQQEVRLVDPRAYH